MDKETNPFKVVFDGPVRERGGTGKINYVDNSFSSNPFLQGGNKKSIFNAGSPPGSKYKVPTSLPDIELKP